MTESLSRRVAEMLTAAGMPEDDLFREAMITSVEAAETARTTAEAAMEAVLTGARGLTPDGEAELVRKVCETVTESTYAEAGRIANRIASGLALKAGAVGVALLVVGFIGGRLTAPDAEAQAVESAPASSPSSPRRTTPRRCGTIAGSTGPSSGAARLARWWCG